MTTGRESVTDVTNVTDFPYPPYVRARAHQHRYDFPVTSVTSVTGFYGLHCAGAVR